MTSKLARSLLSAAAVGALSLGAVACGGAEEPQETETTPQRTERTTPAVTETETVTEMETVTETETVTPPS